MRTETTNTSVCGQLQDHRVAQLQRPDPALADYYSHVSIDELPTPAQRGHRRFNVILLTGGPKTSDSIHRTTVPHLRGCFVNSNPKPVDAAELIARRGERWCLRSRCGC